ncbi:MAG: hypothetical protein EOL95_04645 [Bacteroidia bacterium]|nr:hypothetical protein [Bacteroidia bacterium]
MDIQTRQISNEKLISCVKQAISGGKCARINVKGVSMTPFLIDGRDEVFLDAVNPNNLCVGMILLVETNNTYILHRVVSLSDNHVMLRGDGNISQYENVCFEQIIARVSAVIRNGKRINYKSYHWQLYALFWPKSPRMRIIFLKIYRKLIKSIFSDTIA